MIDSTAVAPARPSPPRRRRNGLRMLLAGAVAAVAAGTGVTLHADRVSAGNGCNTGATLYAGSRLTSGQYLIDSYCQFVLEMQSDGNLVLTQYGTAVWATMTNGNSGAYAKMQTDGNFVVYSSGNVALWASHTSGTGSTNYVRMQTDGNAVLYSGSSGSALWQSGKVVIDAWAEVNRSTPIPYVWGGGHASKPGPSYGTCTGYTGPPPCQANTTIGLDCSGFTRWIYSMNGLDLGTGNTNNQVSEGTSESQSKASPGDLVFFGSSATNTEHVGIYIGGGYMLDALKTGTYLRKDPLSAGGTIVAWRHYKLPG